MQSFCFWGHGVAFRLLFPFWRPQATDFLQLQKVVTRWGGGCSLETATLAMKATGSKSWVDLYDYLNLMIQEVSY
jgi:hypothetical protein